MEEQKYFTPSIEDIRVGYEAEIAYLHEDNWSFTKWRTKEETLATITELLNYNRRIRVPYLTKKQIEAEGWKVENFPYNIIKGVKNTGIYDLNDDMTGIEYNLFYRFENKRLSIESYIINYGKADRPYKGVNCIYFGECKDINTFRYLIKLLEI